MKIAPYLLLLTGVVALRAEAGPMGPSAKMAARLKVRPTSTWLAHYLPDDRYKIAGGVWKYVSTDLDTYYHVASSPLMLKQSADRVIGFSSAAEAEEAGYTAEPGLAPAMPAMGMASSYQDYAPGGPVILSDRVSTLTLPGGWKKIQSFHAPTAGGTNQVSDMAMDIFSKPGSADNVLFVISMTAPNTVNVQKALSGSDFQTVMGGSISNGMIASNRLFSGASVKKVTFKGLNGISIRVGAIARSGINSQPQQGIILARGQKIYCIGATQAFGKTSAYKTIVNSYTPR